MRIGLYVINFEEVSFIFLSFILLFQTISFEGIYTIDDLANTQKMSIPKINTTVLNRLKLQAKLQIESENKGYPIFKVIEENLILNKGFNLLPKPSECDLFFDLEGVQDYVFPGKLEYLFGIYYEENGEKIFKGLTGKYKFEIYFPFILVFSVKIMRYLPLKVYSFIWKKLGNF